MKSASRVVLKSFVPHPLPLPEGEGDGFLPLPGGEGWGEGSIPNGRDSDRTFEIHSTRERAGFTLVELMVVAIIVSIMAAVAIPLMSGSKKRAAATEAEAALGVVYRALRVMSLESGAYNKRPDETIISNGTSVTNIPGVSSGDLDGTFWREDNYEVTSIGPNGYVITATGGTGLVAGVTISLDEKGQFTRNGL